MTRDPSSARFTSRVRRTSEAAGVARRVVRQAEPQQDHRDEEGRRRAEEELGRREPDEEQAADAVADDLHATDRDVHRGAPEDEAVGREDVGDERHHAAAEGRGDERADARAARSASPIRGRGIAWSRSVTSVVRDDEHECRARPDEVGARAEEGLADDPHQGRAEHREGRQDRRPGGREGDRAEREDGDGIRPDVDALDDEEDPELTDGEQLAVGLHPLHPPGRHRRPTNLSDGGETWARGGSRPTCWRGAASSCPRASRRSPRSTTSCARATPRGAPSPPRTASRSRRCSTSTRCDERSSTTAGARGGSPTGWRSRPTVRDAASPTRSTT